MAVQLREEGGLLTNPLEADCLDTSLLHREPAACLSRLARELGGDNHNLSCTLVYHPRDAKSLDQGEE